eukprot:COSAG06_NODE_5437_length_3482_cov_3.053503_2_plen_82_part_00
MDQDGSGTLGGDEIHALAVWVFESFHPGENPLTTEQKAEKAAKIIDELDADGDGVVSFDEFAAWFTKTANQIYRLRKQEAQ